MKRFLIRPKQTYEMETLSMIAQKAIASIPANGHRADQLKEIRLVGSESSGQRELDRYLKEFEGTEKIKTIYRSNGITATTILQMDDEQADLMRHQLHDDVFIVQDRKLSLIEPTPRTNRQTKNLLDDQLWHLTAIGLKEAVSRGMSRKGSGVTVAVMDTGIDEKVPALKGKLAGSYTADIDRLAMISDIPATDTFSNGHGTHVAGLICGDKVGVAPEAKVLNCTVIPNGTGDLTRFVIALDWIASREDVHVVNLSAGLPGYLPEMEPSIAGLLAVGILPVVAVGNEGRHRTRSPGNYRDVLSVGALTKRYRVASFSGSANILNHGQLYSVPDIVAPGDSVYSCKSASDEFEALDGTSMAAAIVSGIACLALQRAIENEMRISIFDLLEDILDAARPLGHGRDRQGMGLAQVI